MPVKREIADKIRQYANQYPVVTITGPRQSGKTTLCRMVFPNIPYVSLESVEERAFALSDPKGFLARHPNRMIIDEIQRAPDLLSEIQIRVDEQQRPGMFVVTGSQNFQLLSSLSQSLAGRTALATLLPFSHKESRRIQKKTISLDQVLYTGSYPRIFDMKLHPTEAMAFYVNTYVERDLRLLINVKDLSRFETFLKLCAGRTGQILNLSSLGNDVGVKHNTIKSWISILEASYIVKLLQPYYRNYRKRLVKAPKLYFLDTGLAAFLLGIQNAEQIGSHPLKGALFETFVVSELLKIRFNEGQTDNLYYFRDHKGNEVDILLDYGLAVDAIEVKAGQTINSDFFKGLEYFSRISDQARNSFLVYGGKSSHQRKGVQIYSWKDLGKMSLS